MTLPHTAHTSRPWRIHELARDFAVEDVWALPTPGGRDDFPRLVEMMAGFDPSHDSPAIVRLLFALRWKLGELFGWEARGAPRPSGSPTLDDRLPGDLRARGAGPPAPAPFTPLYLTDDEWALEVVNRTVHGVLHLGWVTDDGVRYRGQMAVLVKPNGWLGTLYMTAIAPFRHLIVYPLILRALEREWCARASTSRVPELALAPR